MSSQSAPRPHRPWEQKRMSEASPPGEASKFISESKEIVSNADQSATALSTSLPYLPKANPPHIPATLGLGFGVAGSASSQSQTDVSEAAIAQVISNPPIVPPTQVSAVAPSPFTMPVSQTHLQNVSSSFQRYTQLLTLALQSVQSLLANTITLTQRMFMLKMELSAIFKSFAILRVGYGVGSRILSGLKNILLSVLFPFSSRSSSMDAAWNNAVNPHTCLPSPLRPRSSSTSLLSRFMPSVDMASVAAAVLVAWTLVKLHTLLLSASSKEDKPSSPAASTSESTDYTKTNTHVNPSTLSSSTSNIPPTAANMSATAKTAPVVTAHMSQKALFDRVWNTAGS